MQVLGEWTKPIPYDADVELLEALLESLTLVDSVTVTIPVVNGLAIVCNGHGANPAVQTTTIKFNDFVGPRPPVMVSMNTAVSRLWPDSGTHLGYTGGGTPLLYMESLYYLTCPPCPAPCSGSVSYKYISFLISHKRSST
jgi:hypothetical protein